MSEGAPSGQQVLEHRNRHLAAYGGHAYIERASAFAILGAALAVLAHGGLPLWRILAVALILVLLPLVHFIVLRREATPQEVNQRFVWLSVSGQLAMVAFATLTGGLRSPMAPALTMSIVMSMIFFGPRGITWHLTAMLAVLCGIMAVLPQSVTGPTLPHNHLVAATLVGLTWTLIAMHLLVSMLHSASTAALCSLDVSREARIADAEGQTRRLKSVGAKVAHELKNPLTAIKGLIQLVARTPESERTQERLAVVQAEVTRMQTILEEYLSFARPLEDLTPERMDLAVLANEVGGVLAGRIDQGGLRLEFDLQPTVLQADPRRLREAVTNLLANAIEATPRGGVVRMRTRPMPTTNGRAPGGALEIEDTGRGISPADFERLGTSYFTTRVGGTGLGVVLVHGVVTQHGGDLVYESALGRGTVARIELPCEPPSVTNALPVVPDHDLAPSEVAGPDGCAGNAARIGQLLRRRVTERAS